MLFLKHFFFRQKSIYYLYLIFIALSFEKLYIIFRGYVIYCNKCFMPEIQRYTCISEGRILWIRILKTKNLTGWRKMF